jgi:hypothetical protein
LSIETCLQSNWIGSRERERERVIFPIQDVHRTKEDEGYLREEEPDSAGNRMVSLDTAMLDPAMLDRRCWKRGGLSD